MFDSASGQWPLFGKGAGGTLLTYVDAWGGWYNGLYYPTNFKLAQAKFPLAWCVQTSVVSPAAPNVALYDCEQGALSVSQVCAEANTQLVKHQRRPSLYGSASTRADIVTCLAQYYTQWELGRDIDYVLADPDGIVQIPPTGDVGKQYYWGAQYDISVLLPTWSALKPLPVG